jgi:heme-degrading monooxygenase HmoA
MLWSRIRRRSNAHTPSETCRALSAHFEREKVMAVTILIKRKITENNAAELDSLLRRLRSLTVNEKGYISGETLRRVDENGESLVISSWQTLDAWRMWTENEERIELQNEIDLLIGRPTQYEIYENV